MPFVNITERAKREVIQWGTDLTLPITARSLTVAEIGDRNSGQALLIRLLGYPVILLFAVLVVRDWVRGDMDRVLLAGPIVAIAAVGLFYFARFHAARQRAYRDPRIEIVVGADGIALRRAGAAHRIGYHAATVELKLIPDGDAGPRFGGIRLETPFGRIALDDRTYRNGDDAAGAIAARVGALGRELPVVMLRTV